jgi:AcrR family transcriptional regulator
MPSRNPFETHNVTSRRGGPVKQPLSRDAIVAEALRQLTSGGRAGMSLRKVAAALDTGPASLYAYVESLSELHALVLDRALAKVSLRGPAGAGWRKQLQAVLKSYARVLAGSPGLAQLAFGTIAIGPNALRITERILTLLEEGGADLATGAWAVDLLLGHVTATVAEHGNGMDPGAPDGVVARAVAAVSQQQHPRIYAVRVQLFSGSGEARFEWALEVLLAGILKTPRKKSARAR